MRSRICYLLVLSLLLAACEKPPKISGHQELGLKSPAAPPTVTKSQRPPSDNLPEARETPRVLLDEATRISAPEDRNIAIAAVVWENLELDPKLALEAFQQLTPGTVERLRLIQHLAMRLAEQDIEKAIQWAATLDSSEEISLAYGKISLVLAETDPERAANLISDSGIAGREFDVALVQVIQRWAASKPADAAAWVVLFDPGEARTASMKTVVSLWAKNDMQANLAWIGTLQNKDLRQEATVAMAEAILQQPPGIQAEWKQLVSPEVRAAFENLREQAEGAPPK
ncbi:MAG: hypothetical protein ABI600_15325 [Luteolibacter sp.]